MDYVMIRAWGRYAELTEQFIRNEIAIAHEEKAPGNAIYKDPDGLWVTVDKLGSVTRIQVERIAAALQRQENPDHPLDPPRHLT